MSDGKRGMGRRMMTVLSLVAAMALGIVASAVGASPSLVPGEAIISVPHGTSVSVVGAIAGSVNATVVKGWPSIDSAGSRDAYYLRMANATSMSVASTEAAIAKLKADTRTTFAGPNTRIFLRQTAAVTPNDPMFKDQWDKTYLRMPEAWSISKGVSGVTVIISDSGVDSTHPEFPATRYIGGYNVKSGKADGNPEDPTKDIHGTHVAGIAMAQGDNSKGICGNAWDNTKLYSVFTLGESGGTATSAIDTFTHVSAYVKANPGQKYVMNMSWGHEDTSDTPDMTDPTNLALIKVADAGVVITIAAGNSGSSGNPPDWPGNVCPLHKNLINVASSNHLGKRSYYSTYRSTTTIAAPGGDDVAGKQITSTIPLAATSSLGIAGYDIMQGTSMAAPQVCGVVALMLGVGAKPEECKDALTSTAVPIPGLAIPSPEVGYGIVDAYAALAKVAVSVYITEPDGTGGKSLSNGSTPDPVETLRPTVRVAVSQVLPSNLTLTINGTIDTTWTAENVTQYFVDKDGTKYPQKYDAVISGRDFSPGINKIVVTGVRPGTPDRTDTDTRVFVLQPHQIGAGRNLIAIPYLEDGASPESYFGSDFKLARWLPMDGRYAIYSSYGPKEDGASFDRTGVAVHSDGTTTVKAPLGLAYWSDVESVKPVVTRGTAQASSSFVIPLIPVPAGAIGRQVSWNMVGDPFPFDVPFNSLLVDGPEGRMTVGTAADRGYIIPSIYSFDGAQGYSFRTLPDGALRSWTGHWIGVTTTAAISLVVPPLKVGRAAGSASTTAIKGWMLKIGATAGSLHDANNYIGVGAGAADGMDRLDVPKPPLPSPYLSVGSESAMGLLARDIRSEGGTKSYNLSVSTDAANTNVTVTWGAVGTWPRGLKAVLTDPVNGQAVDLRTRSSYTFNTGDNATPRKLVVEAKTVAGDAVRISNLAVRSQGGRASGVAQVTFTMSGDATYDVQVLGINGRSVAKLASRAASAGSVSLVWTGKDSGGRGLPAGTYLVQVRATGTDGESVRVLQPFVLVR